MLESVRNNRIQYQKLTEEEKQQRQILGTLAGPCADIVNPTRNGRTYSEKLWEKVFDSPLVKEQFKAGGIFGELEHPDYDNVNPEKIAVCMPEPPKKGTDGLLYGYWHILNTPCGQILKTLVDYGYKPGISTRGNGDIIEDYNGEESVDPDTYQLNALDIVLIPAVEKARLDLVESVQNKKSLKESLKELVDNSDEGTKKIMNESLAQLNITLTSENAGEAREVSIPVDMTVSDNGDVKIETVTTLPEDDPGIIGETPEVTVTADVVMDAQAQVEQEVEAEVAGDTADNSTGDDNIQVEIKDETVDNAEGSVFDDLQESLKENSSLKQTNESLQNSLSVSIAKEQQLNEELSRCKKKIAELVESQKHIVGLTARANKFEADNTQLTESLDGANSQNKKLNRTLNLQRINIGQLERNCERIKKVNESKLKSLNEALEKSNSHAHELEEEYNRQIQEREDKINSLTENINNQDQDFKSQSEKLQKENEELAKRLQRMTEAYAKLKCQINGVNYNEIHKDLREATVDDINRLTESFVSRKLTENALPFARQDIKKIKYTRPNQSYSKYSTSNNDDIEEWEINQ